MPLPVSTRRAGVMGSAPGPAMALTEDDLPTQHKYHGKVCCSCLLRSLLVHSRGLPPFVKALTLCVYQARLPASTCSAAPSVSSFCQSQRAHLVQAEVWACSVSILLSRLALPESVAPTAGLALMLACKPLPTAVKQCVRALLTRRSGGVQRDDVVFDPEAQEEVPLVPGMGKLDNALRWGFIKKVYGIMSTQLALTAVVAAGSTHLLLKAPPKFFGRRPPWSVRR